MSLLEKEVRRAETDPGPAVYRLSIGTGLIPIVEWWYGGDGAGWRVVPWFLLVLLMLRLVPATIRHMLPFSEDAQARWSRDRMLAKRFDSYQWRKLLWFGAGLTVYLALVGPPHPVATVLAGVCLLGGGLGLVRWKRLTVQDGGRPSHDVHEGVGPPR